MSFFVITRSALMIGAVHGQKVKLKKVKVPHKRSSISRMLKPGPIEVGDRELKQLVRECQKYSVRLAWKIKSVQRDTEAKEDARAGLIMELDDKSKCAVVSILSKSTGQGYEYIQKSIADVYNVRITSKYIMDKEKPVIEKMEIVPD
eukprot:3247043-Ditylum_brightwellii.AAC.1